jgi:hypothetical protein
VFETSKYHNACASLIKSLECHSRALATELQLCLPVQETNDLWHLAWTLHGFMRVACDYLTALATMPIALDDRLYS